MQTSFRFLFLVAFLFKCAVSFGNPPAGFQNEIVVVGLDQPTVIEFLPDGRMLVGEMQESIYVVLPGAGLPLAQPFLQLNSSGLFGGQGLMDIELDPDFDANGYYYIFYTKGSLNRNRVSRFTASGNQTVAGSEVVLWQDIQAATEEHQGGTVAFGPDGKLYITVGEAFFPDDAQRLTSYRGKILRLNRDGTVPSDNPFHDGAGPNLDAIWALGLRNPFRGSFDALTGRFFIGEVGGNDPNTAVEEINLGIRGANYGWPDCEGVCALPGVTSPIYSYPHAGRDAAMVGGFVYRGSQFPNDYYGSFFFADYAQNWIKRLKFDTNGNVSGVFNFEPFDGGVDGPYGDPVCLKQGPDGALYYADFTHDPDNFWAMIRRIRYVSGNQPPTAAVSAFPTAGLPPLTVNFSSTGSSDPEGQPISYSWNFGDGQTATGPSPAHLYAHAGMFVARLSVSDGTNTTLSAPLTIVVGNAPVPTIQSPANGKVFRAGDVVAFAGSATDVEDGVLPASALNWTIVFHHSTHIHPVFGAWSGTNQGSLGIPTSGHAFGYDTSYEIILTATDSSGLQTATSVTVEPDLVNLTLNTVPDGLTVKLDGISRATPFTDGALIGFQHTVEAPNQIVAGSNLIFQAWSQGGPQAQTFVVPASDQTLTASYRVPVPGEPVIESAVLQGGSLRIGFSSMVGRLYRVEHSVSMEPGSWSKLADRIEGTGATVEVVEPSIQSPVHQFYRVLLLPGDASTGTNGLPSLSASAEAHGLDVTTLNATLTSSGSNRVLVVGLCWNDRNGGNVTVVTFNGIPCNHVMTTNWFYGSGQLAFYTLTAPVTGNHLLAVTMSGAIKELSMSGLVLTNASQGANIGAAAANSASLPVNSISVDVPATANDLVLDLFGYYAFDPAAGPGQSERIFSNNNGNASNRMSTKPGAAALTTMTWSISDNTECALIGVAVKGR